MAERYRFEVEYEGNVYEIETDTPNPNPDDLTRQMDELLKQFERDESQRRGAMPTDLGPEYPAPSDDFGTGLSEPPRRTLGPDLATPQGREQVADTAKTVGGTLASGARQTLTAGGNLAQQIMTPGEQPQRQPEPWEIGIRDDVQGPIETFEDRVATSLGFKRPYKGPGMTPLASQQSRALDSDEDLSMGEVPMGPGTTLAGERARQNRTDRNTLMGRYLGSQDDIARRAGVYPPAAPRDEVIHPLYSKPDFREPRELTQAERYIRDNRRYQEGLKRRPLNPRAQTIRDIEDTIFNLPGAALADRLSNGGLRARYRDLLRGGTGILADINTTPEWIAANIARGKNDDPNFIADMDLALGGLLEMGVDVTQPYAKTAGKFFKDAAEAFRSDDLPTFINQFTEGMATLGVFYAIGLGTAGAVGRIATVSPTVAAITGASVQGTLEAYTESMNTFREQVERGVPREVAAKQANEVFAHNIALDIWLDKVGLEARGPLFRRVFKGAVAEGTQELMQYDIQQRVMWVPYDPIILNPEFQQSSFEGTANAPRGSVSFDTYTKLKRLGWIDTGTYLYAPWQPENAFQAGIIGGILGGGTAILNGAGNFRDLPEMDPDEALRYFIRIEGDRSFNEVPAGMPAGQGSAQRLDIQRGRIVGEPTFQQVPFTDPIPPGQEVEWYDHEGIIRTGVVQTDFNGLVHVVQLDGTETMLERERLFKTRQTRRQEQAQQGEVQGEAQAETAPQGPPAELDIRTQGLLPVGADTTPPEEGAVPPPGVPPTQTEAFGAEQQNLPVARPAGQGPVTPGRGRADLPRRPQATQMPPEQTEMGGASQPPLMSDLGPPPTAPAPEPEPAPPGPTPPPAGLEDEVEGLDEIFGDEGTAPPAGLEDEAQGLDAIFGDEGTASPQPYQERLAEQLSAWEADPMAPSEEELGRMAVELTRQQQSYASNPQVAEQYADLIDRLDAIYASREAEPEPGPRPTGRSVAYTPTGRAVETQLELVEGDTLITSHDDALNPRADFPQELQPRDRERAGSLNQVETYAQTLNPELLGENPLSTDGAPIVGDDNLVESGNARTLAIVRALRENRPTGGRYRRWLIDHAEAFGIDPEAVATMQHPVLIRRRLTALSPADRIAFTQESNLPTTEPLPPADQAKVDALQMTPELLGLLNPDSRGNLGAASNREFTRLFMEQVVPGPQQGALVGREGETTQQLITRMRNAIFRYTYGDSDAVFRLAEDPDANVRNITHAMLIVAPDLARLQADIASGQAPENISPATAMVEAVNQLSRLRDQEMTVEGYLAQGALFGDDLSPAGRTMLRLFDANSRSYNRIADVLRHITRLARNVAPPEQGSLLDDAGVPVPTIEELIERGIEAYQNETGRQLSFTDVPATDANQTGVDNTTPDAATAGAEQAMLDLDVLGDSSERIEVDGERFEIVERDDTAGALTLERNIERSEIIEQLRQEGVVRMRGQTITNAEDLAVLAQMIRDPRFETLYTVYVDARGEILDIVVQSSGIPDMVEDGYDVSVEEHERIMTELGATGFYELHNHPAGTPEPSDNDVAASQRSLRLYRGYRGEVIVDTGQYGYLDGRGGRYLFDLPPGTATPMNVRASQLAPDTAAELQSGYLANVARRLMLDGYGVLFQMHGSVEAPPTDTDVPRAMRLRAVQLVPIKTLQDPEALRAFLRESSSRYGGRTTVLHTGMLDASTLRSIRQTRGTEAGMLSGHIIHDDPGFFYLSARAGRPFRIPTQDERAALAPGDYVAYYEYGRGPGRGYVISANISSILVGRQRQSTGGVSMSREQVIGIQVPPQGASDVSPGPEGARPDQRPAGEPGVTPPAGGPQAGAQPGAGARPGAGDVGAGAAGGAPDAGVGTDDGGLPGRDQSDLGADGNPPVADAALGGRQPGRTGPGERGGTERPESDAGSQAPAGGAEPQPGADQPDVPGGGQDPVDAFTRLSPEEIMQRLGGGRSVRLRRRMPDPDDPRVDPAWDDLLDPTLPGVDDILSEGANPSLRDLDDTAQARLDFLEMRYPDTGPQTQDFHRFGATMRQAIDMLPDGHPAKDPLLGRWADYDRIMQSLEQRDAPPIPRQGARNPLEQVPFEPAPADLPDAFGDTPTQQMPAPGSHFISMPELEAELDRRERGESHPSTMTDTYMLQRENLLSVLASIRTLEAIASDHERYGVHVIGRDDIERNLITDLVGILDRASLSLPSTTSIVHAINALTERLHDLAPELVPIQDPLSGPLMQADIDYVEQQIGFYEAPDVTLYPSTIQFLYDLLADASQDNDRMRLPNHAAVQARIVRLRMRLNRLLVDAHLQDEQRLRRELAGTNDAPLADMDAIEDYLTRLEDNPSEIDFPTLHDVEQGLHQALQGIDPDGTENTDLIARGMEAQARINELRDYLTEESGPFDAFDTGLPTDPGIEEHALQQRARDALTQSENLLYYMENGLDIFEHEVAGVYSQAQDLADRTPPGSDANNQARRALANLVEVSRQTRLYRTRLGGRHVMVLRSPSQRWLSRNAPLRQGAEFLTDMVRGLSNALSNLFRRRSESDPRVDPARYARAKPIFESAFAKIERGEASLDDFFTFLREHFGPAIFPYVLRFQQEMAEARRAQAAQGEPQPMPDVEPETTQAEGASEAEPPPAADLFTPWTPTTEIAGAHRHPGRLVEALGLAGVQQLPVSFELHEGMQAHIQSGAMSHPQVEVAMRIGQAHSRMLKDDEGGDSNVRRGFLLGWGTGTGKTHVIVGTLLDNLLKGRKRAIVLSAKRELFDDATEIWQQHFGQSPSDWFLVNQFTRGSTIDPATEGILFSTYATLQNQWRDPQTSRVEQIVKWAGPRFDGVLVFDESHAGANNMDGASASALAMLELQRRLPGARVIYASATSAQEVANLGYAERLGLWGPGTDFADAQQFARTLEQSGLNAMEAIARDLKALGVFSALNLDWSDVRFDRSLQIPLTDEQVEMYDEVADAWTTIMRQLDEVLDQMAELDGNTVSSGLRGQLRGQFFVRMQMFFNQFLTALQMGQVEDTESDTILNAIQRDLDAGRSVLLQVAYTNYAQQQRQTDALSDDDLQEFNFSPAEHLQDYIARGFPVFRTEVYRDRNTGRRRTRIQRDANGDPIPDPIKVQIRDELMRNLAGVFNRLPQNPLEAVFARFGEDAVAEMTGRPRRPMWVVGEDGRRTRIMQNVSAGMRHDDVEAFKDQHKRILIFSAGKGGTGFSFHADLGRQNQQQRAHYVLQTGWQTIQVMQALGRGHRSNQAVAPYIRLTSTDLPGHRRFNSTIARKLGQIGALGQGDRGAAGHGLFNYRDNLESAEATRALEHTLNDLIHGRIPGLTAEEVQHGTGLRFMRVTPPAPGAQQNVEPARALAAVPDMRRFLNRLLGLSVAQQNLLFDAFSTRLDTVIEDAINTGTLETGIEELAGDSIEVVEWHRLAKHDETGAETVYQKLRRTRRQFPMGHAALRTRLQDLAVDGAREGFGRFLGFYRTPDGRLVAATSALALTGRDGHQTERVRVLFANGTERVMSRPAFEEGHRYRRITSSGRDENIQLWQEAMDAVQPTLTDTLHTVSGLIIPYWGKIGRGARAASQRVYRITPDGGQPFLGRVIPHEQIAQVLRNFGQEAEGLLDLAEQQQNIDLSPTEVYQGLMESPGARVRLSNSTVLSSTTQNGMVVLTVSRYPYNQRRQLEAMGVRINRQGLGTFPSDPAIAPALISYIMAGHNVREMSGIQRHAPDPDAPVPRRAPEPDEPLRAQDFGRGLDDILAHDLNEASEAQRRRAGIRDETPLVFDNAPIENWFQRNLAPTEPGLYQRAFDATNEWIRHWGRDIASLPNTGRFARIHNALLRLQRQGPTAHDKAVRMLSTILDGLTANERDILNRFWWLDDVQEDLTRYENELGLEAQNTLVRIPDGFTRANIDAALQAARQRVAASPRLSEADALRRRIWDQLKASHIEAMDAIGADISSVYNRLAYFRHDVLDHAYSEGLARGSRGKVETPRYRSHLRRRDTAFRVDDDTGELLPTYDYRTEYITAEFHVFSQILYDIEVARVIKVAMEEHDMRPEDDLAAAAANDRRIMTYFEAMAARLNAERAMSVDNTQEEVTADQLYRRILNRPIAQAFERVFGMAADNALPNDGRWNDLLDAMAQAYVERREMDYSDLDPAFAPDDYGRLPEAWMPSLFKYLNWVLSLPGTDLDAVPAKGAATQLFTSFQGKRQMMRNIIEKELMGKMATWRDFIDREREREWQPLSGSVFYLGHTIPESVARRLIEGEMEQFEVHREDLNEVLVRGRQRREMVLPIEVADALDLFFRRPEPSWIQEFGRQVTRSYKSWILNNPMVVVPIQIRNLSGDAVAAVLGNPRTFLFVPQAVEELFGALVQHGPLEGDMLYWYERGGPLSGMIATELNELNRLHSFLNRLEREDHPPIEMIRELRDNPMGVMRRQPMAKLQSLIEGVRRGWEGIRLTVDFRENILRYAAYKSYLDFYREHGRWPNYGASLRDEIERLTEEDPRAAAFYLANDLMLSYDRTSVNGRGLREFIYPFWSFSEGNMKRYIRFVKNAAYNDTVAEKVGRRLLGRELHGNTLAAMRVGTFFIKAAGVFFLLATMSRWFFPDDDDKLREDIRSMPHITWGHNQDGSVRAIGRIGLLHDILEWFNLDGSEQIVRRLLQGESKTRLALDIAKGPVQKMVGGLNPLVTATATGLTGLAFYPDVFNPRPVRNRVRQLLGDVGLRALYPLFSQAPNRSAERMLTDLITPSYNEDQGAISDMYSLEDRFLRRMGKKRPIYFYSDLNSAFWAYRQAVRLDDKESMNHWLGVYYDLGGTPKTMETSFKQLEPLSALSELEQAIFFATLDQHDAEVYIRGLEAFYRMFEPPRTSR